MQVKIEWQNKDEDYGKVVSGVPSVVERLKERYPLADPKRLRVRRVGDQLTYLYKHRVI